MATAKTTKKTTTAKKAVKKVDDEPVKKAVVPADTADTSVADETKTNELPDDKQHIIDSFAQHTGDTGSPEVQVALLTHKIAKLAEHLGPNKKDMHSRRGLLKTIAKRRRLLNYLKELELKRYTTLIKRLGLKK